MVIVHNGNVATVTFDNVELELLQWISKIYGPNSFENMMIDFMKSKKNQRESVAREAILAALIRLTPAEQQVILNKLGVVL